MAGASEKNRAVFSQNSEDNNKTGRIAGSSITCFLEFNSRGFRLGQAN